MKLNKKNLSILGDANALIMMYWVLKEWDTFERDSKGRAMIPYDYMIAKTGIMQARQQAAYRRMVQTGHLEQAVEYRYPHKIDGVTVDRDIGMAIELSEKSRTTKFFE